MWKIVGQIWEIPVNEKPAYNYGMLSRRRKKHENLEQFWYLNFPHSGGFHPRGMNIFLDMNK